MMGELGGECGGKDVEAGTFGDDASSPRFVGKRKPNHRPLTNFLFSAKLQATVGKVTNKRANFAII
jgi:hypothetical protein